MGDKPRPKQHHWWRWIFGVLVAALVIVVVAVIVMVKLQPSPAPLALPANSGPTPSGSLDGLWRAGPGSIVGFRVEESAIGVSSDVVGRTREVEATVEVSENRVNAASVRIDLSTIKVNGKTEAQFDKSLDTAVHPEAIFSLTAPIELSPRLASGATAAGAASGEVTMNGISRPVTFTVSSQWSGGVVRTTGSFPVTFSSWSIQAPPGYGFFGSLADHGLVEFLLVFHRASQ